MAVPPPKKPARSGAGPGPARCEDRDLPLDRAHVLKDLLLARQVLVEWAEGTDRGAKRHVDVEGRATRLDISFDGPDLLGINGAVGQGVPDDRLGIVLWVFTPIVVGGVSVIFAPICDRELRVCDVGKRQHDVGEEIGASHRRRGVPPQFPGFIRGRFHHADGAQQRANENRKRRGSLDRALPHTAEMRDHAVTQVLLPVAELLRAVAERRVAVVEPMSRVGVLRGLRKPSQRGAEAWTHWGEWPG